MIPHIDEPLKTLVDVEIDSTIPSPDAEMAMTLTLYEFGGLAMRYVTESGEIGWKASPSLLRRLRDEEQDAIVDLDSEDD